MTAAIATRLGLAPAEATAVRMPPGAGRIARRPAQPDWPSIEPDYRGGRYSLRQLAALHRCSHSTIANKARREGWTRDGMAGGDGAVVEAVSPA